MSFLTRSCPRLSPNPVYDGEFADPFVFLAEGRAFAVGTGPTLDPADRVPVLVSDDLERWEPLHGALRSFDLRLGTDVWAPEVAHHEGRYYLYYSSGEGDRGHQLRVAVADRPEGPYEDVGHPVLDPSTCDFAIDASPFRDADGTWYLFYSRDLVDSPRPGTCLVVAPLDGMTRIGPEFTVVSRARHEWQRYEADRSTRFGALDWHTLEGANVHLVDGRYWCLYSGGNWQNESYGVDFLVADHPLGPYLEAGGGEHARVLRTTGPTMRGPGHNSAFRTEDGDWWIAYHAWFPGRGGRQFCLDRLTWGPEGPRCLEPGR